MPDEADRRDAEPAAKADEMTIVHGTAVAVGGRAALIRGPSGSGKSDLALRCIFKAPNAMTREQALLVSDDYVELRTVQDGDGAQQLRISAPDQLRDKLEVRGLGIAPVACVQDASLVLIVDLVARGDVERFPSPIPTETLRGVALPCIQIHAFDASAPEKLLLALTQDLERWDSP